MTPTDLLASVFHQRGLDDSAGLPATVLFDDRHCVDFSEPAPGLIAFECRLDCLVPGDEPTLQSRLLGWNRHGAIVGPGAFSLAGDGGTFCYRVTLPAALLDVEAFKILVHEFLDRVDRIEAALVENPYEADTYFTAESPAPSTASEGMIGV